MNSEDLRVFRAVVARKMADEPEYVSVKNLINMTYELDSISIAQNIGNDEQLGELVIETGMNDTVLKLPHEALELLDTSPNFLGESMTVKEFAESDMSDLSDGMEMSL